MSPEPSAPTAASATDPGPTWQKSTLRDYFESICIAVIFALFVRTFVVQAFKIPSSSMEDNLLVGDHILVNKFAYAPHSPWMEKVLPYKSIQREDVFVFKYPKDPQRDFIKRVVGSGGDRVEIRRGRVIRNEELIKEPYVFVKGPPALMEHDNHEEVRVPPGHFFAMGDNRLNSEDSRYWGSVPGSHVKGKAVLIYWSFELPADLKHIEVRSDPSPREKGAVLRYTIVNFLSKTRWGRTFKLVE